MENGRCSSRALRSLLLLLLLSADEPLSRRVASRQLKQILQFIFDDDDYDNGDDMMARRFFLLLLHFHLKKKKKKQVVRAVLRGARAMKQQLKENQDDALLRPICKIDIYCRRVFSSSSSSPRCTTAVL